LRIGIERSAVVVALAGAENIVGVQLLLALAKI
jgi:hypothetical protein